MIREVRLGGWGPVLPHDRTVITPNENAADTLGVSPVSLDKLAQLMVGEDRLAHPVLVQRSLQESVKEVTGSKDSEGVARAMLPAIRELFRAAPEFEATPGSRRARRVFEVARVYRELLREQGLLDPSEALWEAARLCTSRHPLLVWGYPRFGQDELAFVDAVAGEGSVVYLPWANDPIFGANRELARELARRGWSVEEDPLGRVWEPDVSLQAYAYPHLEAEVRGTLAQIKALLVEGVPQDDIVIVARDDAFYGPTLLTVAKEYGVPLRALYRVAIGDTRVGAWLHLLFEAVTEGFPFETTARLLAHPLGPGIRGKAWSEARKLRACGSSSWVECGVELSSLNLLEAWPEEDTRALWVGRFMRLLYEQDLGGKVRLLPREVVALSRLRDAIRWLAEPEEERISREQFISEVGETMSVTTTPAHPTGKGVALHTPLSLYGARYRHVFALGLAEGSHPAPVADDPVLDFHERRRLSEEGIRLELAGERARRERLSFWTLLRVPRERLVLSYPKVSGNRAYLPSPYFELLGVELVSPESLPAASPEEARRAFLQRSGFADSVLEHATRAWEVERRRESAAPFDAHDGVLGFSLEGEDWCFSASQLADLVRCGFKWWAGSVLGLREPEEGDSPVVLGRLSHRTLELAVRRAGEKPAGSLRDGVLAHLEEAFTEAEEEIEAHRMRAWQLQRGLRLEILRQAVVQEGFMLPEAEVVATESSFTGGWRGFELTGRVDRVDRTPEGLVFVDYKTGSSKPQPDLQLAIYHEAAAQMLFPGEPAHDAYYYSLRAGERIKAKPLDEAELAAMVEDVRERLRLGHLPPDVLEDVRERLRLGHLPPDVLERDPAQRACATCAYDLVCRKGARLDRKLGRVPGEGGDA